MTQDRLPPLSRRRLLTLIGEAAGSSVMYQAMTSLGLAAESDYKGAIRLEGNPKGASVLILGAGLAGLAAALELRNAGYKVQVLEAGSRAGGRSRTLRGGDEHIDVDAVRQTCRFDEGLYFNAGAWRIPYHHHALLDYCRRLGVPLEPFVQVNQNAYLHSAAAFEGRPQRYRHVQADFQGHLAELLAKTADRGRLDQAVAPDDKAILLDALRQWGALDKNYSYRENSTSSGRRGYARDPGGGLTGAPGSSKPVSPGDLMKSGLWRYLAVGLFYNFQSTMFQPVGGMDRIAQAFASRLGETIRFEAEVTAVKQGGSGVAVTYRQRNEAGAERQATADWCVCTIPLPVLGRIDLDVGTPMREAIRTVPYASAVKVGLQFKRRFWEEDEAIYGGITFTDLPIGQIGYPSADYLARGKGVLLGAYQSGARGLEFGSVSPAEQVRRAVEYGSKIHSQYKGEFENGIAVAWHRDPWTLGCYGLWADDARERHYKALCEIDGRIVLAGEHTSYLNAWQEGAVLSALDAIRRLHRRVVNT